MLPALLVAGGALWVRQQLQPASDSAQKVRVVIPPDSGAPRVAHILAQDGVIRNATAFLWYARLHGEAGKLKAGRYRLAPNMTLDEIIDRLKRGGSETEDRTVTIPEGYTLGQIAEALQTKGVIADPQAFLQIVKSKNPGLTAPFKLPKTGLEGYLYPDTYRFLPNSRPERVAQAMLDSFTKQFYEPNQDAIARSGHSLHQIVTIASLIEREAEVPQDRPKIAGVIENRLRRHMRLQIDATLDYAHGHHLSRVLYKDLAIKSPYNTYRYAGLPPGPIASPGKASLEAALHPEHSDYLYYVAGPNKAHIFARTEAEHNQNVARVRAQAHALAR